MENKTFNYYGYEYRTISENEVSLIDSKRLYKRVNRRKMRVLTFLTFVIAITFMVGVDIFLFSEDVIYGIGGVMGIIGFIIAYSISGDMIIAPRDYWRLSSWQVFKQKFGYGMNTYILITFVSAAILQVMLG